MQKSIKLSIVIVNYNVEHFLEQCLYSVEKAIQPLSAEVFVVDNDSVDGSCDMITDKFPWVTLIQNKVNLGFSKANNQAIKLSVGEYVLLLNPDTVVEEDTFVKTVSFMDNHQNSGGLGVKMIDGKGNFLPESKRGVPTPMVAFYKIFGLSKLFPKSPKFSRYHLGHLDKDCNHKVDILSGAFMLMRKSVLDEIGLLDEDYFMYGEDIDLSYRIIKAGYDNYYFSDTAIIHYKGESTKKGSINYVLVFYRAMIIFARKQLSSSHANIFGLLINCAIYLRAFLSIAKRLIKTLLLPAIDYSIFIVLMTVISRFYELDIKELGFAFPRSLYQVAIPIYSGVWIIMFAVSNTYRAKILPIKYFKNVAITSAVLFLAYSFLPENLRYSRALLLAGSVIAFTILPLFRLLLSTLKVFDFSFSNRKTRNGIIVASEKESDRIMSIVNCVDVNFHLAKIIEPSCFSHNGELFHQISNSIQVYKADEIIFSAESLSSTAIIEFLLKSSFKNVDYKIAPPESVSIIGSNSIHTSGELYVLNLNSINSNKNILYKRLLDIIISVLVLLISPILIGFMKNKKELFLACYDTLKGTKTWVSYFCINEINDLDLPKLKPGIFNPLMSNAINNESIVRNQLVGYAKNYNFWLDIQVIWRKWNSQF